MPRTRRSTGCSSATRRTCASSGVPLVTGLAQRLVRGRGRVPHRPRRVRAARRRVHGVRAGRARPGEPGLAAGQPGRPRRPRAGEAQGARGRDRRGVPGRRRAAGPRGRARLRTPLRRHPGPRPRHLRLPHPRGRGRDAAPRALGPDQPGRSLVRRRPRPRPRRAAAPSGCPGSRAPSAGPARRAATRSPRTSTPASSSPPPGSGTDDRDAPSCGCGPGGPCCSAGGRPRSSRRRRTGWDVVRVPVADAAALAQEVAGLRARRRRPGPARRARRRRPHACSRPCARRPHRRPGGRRAAPGGRPGRHDDCRLRRAAVPAAGDGAVAAATGRASASTRPPGTSGSPRPSSSPTSSCCSSAAPRGTCPTTSSRPTGSRARSTWRTPTRSRGRCGCPSTRPSRCSPGCGRWPRCRACTTVTRSTRALPKLSAAAGDAALAASALSASIAARGRGARARGRPVTASGGTAACTCATWCPAATRRPSATSTRCACSPVDGRWYLEGWCHRAEGVRLFRLDRIEAIEVLDADGTPPADAVGRDVDERLFAPSPEDVRRDGRPRARRARWVADYYPVEHVAELGDGRLRVTLRAADAGWVPRLALRLAGALRVVDPVGARRRGAPAARRRPGGLPRSLPERLTRRFSCRAPGRAASAVRIRLQVTQRAQDSSIERPIPRQADPRASRYPSIDASSGAGGARP